MNHQISARFWSAALRAAFTLAFTFTLAGCSTFNKEWKTATHTSTNDIEGRWSGEWRSEKNNHHGSLRAVITQTSTNTYRAHYRAKYMKILRFSYVATLNGTTSNNIVTLEGSADLGKLAGGIYTYKATATPTTFHSTYECKYDHGRYEMTRPPTAPQ